MTREFFTRTIAVKAWSVSDTPIIKGTAGSGIFSIAMFDKLNGIIVGGNYEKPNEINDNLAFTNDGGSELELGKRLKRLSFRRNIC